MGLEIILLLLIIIGALFLFVTGYLSVDLTAIFTMVALMVTGILTPSEAISGFSNTATITILGLLMISEGLRNTGTVEEIGDLMLRVSSKQTWKTMLVVMLISAIASAFINNTAIVAVFIPVMFRISEATGVQARHLLMPLSFASMTGGAITMIGTSTNLLINSIAQENGLSEFSIFQPAPMGAVLLVAVLLFMAYLGRHLIKSGGKDLEVFDKTVQQKNYITEVTIPKNSKYIGKDLTHIDLNESDDFQIVRVNLASGNSIDPQDARVLEEGDTLVIKTDVKHILLINEDPNLRITTNLLSENRGVKKNDIEEELFEVLVTNNSELLDQRIKDVNWTSYYDAHPLAIRTNQLRDAKRLGKHRSEYGDIMLMSGKSHTEDEKERNTWITVQRFSKDEIKSKLPERDKMWIAVASTLGAILLAVFNVLPILTGAWLAVGIMVASGCITLKKAYDNVEWKVIFLLAGIIPLGMALEKTGATDLLTGLIEQASGGLSLRWLIFILFGITVTLTGIISNQATAVLLVPLAIQLANELGFSPEPLLMTILFGASTSFLTPVGYQTNAMILGPGDYDFKEFLKVGGLLCLVFWALVTWLVPILYA